MTKSGVGERGQGKPIDDDPRCRWCRRVLAPQAGPGRPRHFCSQACRQWDWVARQRARELQISEDQLVIARDELNQLHDALYVLACAVADVKADLATSGSPTSTELTEMLRWILECADPLEKVRLRP
jgi:hypothetical protein